MERIVFLDRKTVRADFRQPNFANEWQEFALSGSEDVVERLRDATIAITNKVPLRERELEQLPNLKMIAVAATGTDCVDAEYCDKKGIVVSNVSNYSVNSVPEHVFTLILGLRRQILSYHRDILAGKWQTSDIFCMLDHPMTEVHNSTLGIIGYGTLGKAVENVARAFGMNVIIAEHKDAETIREGRTPFDEVLRRSDILTLHCPLTDTTRGLIGPDEFKVLKGSSLLINCGRGGLVDEEALADALKRGLIAGAGTDVLSTEPPSRGNPLLEADLRLNREDTLKFDPLVEG